MGSTRLAVCIISTWFVILMFSSQTGSAMRRRRCSPRLCRRCDVFVNSRWRRSLPEFHPGKSEFTPNLAPGISPNALLQLLQNGSSSTLIDGSESHHPKRKIFDIIRRMQGREMDDAEMLDGAYNRDLPDRSYGGMLKSRVQRRSLSSHVRRCLRILRTPCCRRFKQSVFIIGYRLK